jgi:hypothetical protein
MLSGTGEDALIPAWAIVGSTDPDPKIGRSFDSMLDQDCIPRCLIFSVLKVKSPAPAGTWIELELLAIARGVKEDAVGRSLPLGRVSVVLDPEECLELGTHGSAVGLRRLAEGLVVSVSDCLLGAIS